MAYKFAICNSRSIGQPHTAARVPSLRLKLIVASLITLPALSMAQERIEVRSASARPLMVAANAVNATSQLVTGEGALYGAVGPAPAATTAPLVSPATPTTELTLRSSTLPASPVATSSAAPIVVAQAPGAGGASVPAAPSTPQVQTKPAVVPVPPPAPSTAPTGPKFEIRAFEVEGATLIPKAEIDRLLQPFAGKDKDFGDVQKALEALEKQFVAQGFGSVQVLLPEQELDRGTVRFQVIEPKIAKVVIEGNKAYSEANILASLPAVKPGTAPNSNAIGQNLRLANENPGKATTVLLRAGSNDGEVDAVVKVTEDRPLKFNVGLDNTGAGNTGMFRYGFGVSHANFLGRDHVVAAQIITSPEEANVDVPREQHPKFKGFSKDVLIIGASYRVPLYASGNSLDFSAGFSNVNSGNVAGIFNVSGRGSVFGARFTQNLAKLGDYEHRLIYAWDYRAYNNNAVPLGGGNSVAPNITVKPISLTYSGTYREPTAETTFYLGYNKNMPGGGNGGSGQWEAGTNAVGVGARPGGRPGYVIWRYGLSHYRAFANDWQVRFNLTGQETRDRLIAPEQFGLGGATSIRGFDERKFANDYGSYLNLEVYTPDFASDLKVLGTETKVRGVAFHDYGHLVRNGPNATDQFRVTASSLGVGLRISHGNSLTIRLDGAWTNKPSHINPTDTPATLPGVTRNFRMHGALVYLF